MYECLSDTRALLGSTSERDPALAHIGQYDRVLRMHELHAAMAASGDHLNLPPIGPFLLDRLANPATMMCACRALLRSGPKASGLNGLRLEDLSENEMWSLCHTLASALRDGIYRPGPDRTVRILKETPGQFRKLTIQNVEDRIVAKALVLILQPLLDPKFSPFSFGFRPGRGAQSALATALAYAREEGRWRWVVDDIRRAFDMIPHSRFLDACRKHFPPEIVQVISIISYAGNKHGLRQGSPASPFFMNLFFDHFLDWRWYLIFPSLPLFRYADDVLITCETRDEVIATYSSLERRLTGVGTPLKSSAQASIHDLGAGESVDWLGYTICLDGGEPCIRIADRAWRRLRIRLMEEHLKPAPPIRAIQAIQGWLGYLGPCYRYEDRATILDRVRDIAAQEAFDELPAPEELGQWWCAAHARWHRVYQQEQATLSHRLSLIRQRS